MTWLKNAMKWAKILWNLRTEIEGIARLLQKHKVYLENDFEALKKLKTELENVREVQK